MAACIALLYQCRELAKNQKTDTKKPRISTRLYMFGAGTKSRTRDLLITSQNAKHPFLRVENSSHTQV